MSLWGMFSKKELNDLADLIEKSAKNYDPVKDKIQREKCDEVMGTGSAITEYFNEGEYAIGITKWTDTRQNKTFILKTIVEVETYGKMKFQNFRYISTINDRIFSRASENYYKKERHVYFHDLHKKLAFSRIYTEYRIDPNTDLEHIFS